MSPRRPRKAESSEEKPIRQGHRVPPAPESDCRQHSKTASFSPSFVIGTFYEGCGVDPTLANSDSGKVGKVNVCWYFWHQEILYSMVVTAKIRYFCTPSNTKKFHLTQNLAQCSPNHTDTTINCKQDHLPWSNSCKYGYRIGFHTTLMR